MVNLRRPGLCLAEVILLVVALTESMAKKGGNSRERAIELKILRDIFQ
ncbi:hypothetical protein BN434_0623 [Erwinia amylovora CFBP 2585]|nr:hypothetical protein BN434_0623 [Erwinia amylovora CFBP 2585]